MRHIEVEIPVADPELAEIYIAELAEFPFESFDPDKGALKAYINEESFEDCRQEVERMLRQSRVDYTIRVIEPVNWNQVWESQFEPVRIGDRCVIRAPFHPAPAPGVLDLVIMPKMSFGTGHHATTRLMTAELFRHDLRGLSGLDMGSGTGVLAIAAAKLGARGVDAVDIEEWAYNNSIENIEQNDVRDMVFPIMGDVGSVAGRRYDFILANINRNILLADMGTYAELLNPGGLLIVSGILEQDISSIMECAAGAGLAPFDIEGDGGITLSDGWAAVRFRRS